LEHAEHAVENAESILKQAIRAEQLDGTARKAKRARKPRQKKPVDPIGDAHSSSDGALVVPETVSDNVVALVQVPEVSATEHRKQEDNGGEKGSKTVRHRRSPAQ
jgi:hypothetical protein